MNFIFLGGFMNDYDKLAKYVTAIKNGNLEKFEDLYLMTYEKVYFTAHKLVKNSHDAEDITQNVYIKVLSTLNTLNDPKAFMAWIMKITVNTALNHVKKNKVYIIDIEETKLQDKILGDEELNLDEIIDKKEVQLTILNMIEALPIEQKIVTILYYYEQLSIAQIAEITEASESAVKGRLFNARKNIKKAVQVYEKKTDTQLLPFAIPSISMVLQHNTETNMLSPENAANIFLSIVNFVGITCLQKAEINVDYIIEKIENASKKKVRYRISDIVIEFKAIPIIVISILLIIGTSFAIYYFNNKTPIDDSIIVNEENGIELVNLSVVRLPNKVTYKTDESFDTTGLKLQAEYSDGTIEIIDKDYTIVDYDSNIRGTNNITINYKNAATTIPITVSNAASVQHKTGVVDRLAIDAHNAIIFGEVKKAANVALTEIGCYFWEAGSDDIVKYPFKPSRDYIDVDVITIWYNIADELFVNLKENTPYSYQVYAVVDGIEYTDNVATFTTLNSPIADIVLESLPNILEYKVNDILDKSGLSLKATLENGNELIITTGIYLYHDVLGYSSYKLYYSGVYPLNVEYLGYKFSFEVTVNE